MLALHRRPGVRHFVGQQTLQAVGGGPGGGVVAKHEGLGEAGAAGPRIGILAYEHPVARHRVAEKARHRAVERLHSLAQNIGVERRIGEPVEAERLLRVVRVRADRSHIVVAERQHFGRYDRVDRALAERPHPTRAGRRGGQVPGQMHLPGTGANRGCQEAVARACEAAGFLAQVEQGAVVCCRGHVAGRRPIADHHVADGRATNTPASIDTLRRWRLLGLGQRQRPLVVACSQGLVVVAGRGDSHERQGQTNKPLARLQARLVQHHPNAEIAVRAARGVRAQRQVELRRFRGERRRRKGAEDRQEQPPHLAGPVTGGGGAKGRIARCS